MDCSSFKTSLGKKLIAVALCVTAFVFLSFSVFGETDFGYSTSVSNQDTINGVVITLKANRGSLVNSGTAALGYSGYCPILISVTLQNTNNQNVLINNLKFKVTTNSSGNFSRIVSFEQLSNDLIVAETPFDLNNYISIVPSNEYSYGTGIVVPANSSMYMVCLMNVYANYDTSVNQWQVPSLQYIGYDQNITVTTGDYHSSGVPVDLNEVVDALSDLINTVSTSDELQQLITLLTYSGSNPNVSLVAGSTQYGQIPLYNNISGFVWARYSPEVYSTYDYEYNNSNDTAVSVGTKRMYFEYLFCLNSTQPTMLTYYYHIFNILPTNINQVAMNVTEFYSDIYTGYDTYDGVLDLYGKHNITTSTCAIPYGRSYTVMRGYYEYDINTILTKRALSGLNVVSIMREPSVYSGYYPRDEYTILRDLYLAYSNVNGLDNIDDSTDDIKDKSESAHTQEQSYFTQNTQAIQATGLSNYRFSNDQENGISSVSHDFVLLWNSLGGFNSIYVFSLTLSLALMILRHAPNAIKSSRRNKEE